MLSTLKPTPNSAKLHALVTLVSTSFLIFKFNVVNICMFLDPSDWAGYKPTNESITTLGSTPATENRIITSKSGAKNYPQCPLVDTAIKTFMAANFNNSGYTVQ